ncbi:MAG TPA: hypothetical protein VII52_14495 [Gemmatimonadaceae bacterium]
MSVEEPELEPPTTGAVPPSPHEAGGAEPESARPPLDPPLPLLLPPLLCDPPPELPADAPLPELPPLPPPLEPLLAVPGLPGFPSDGAELLPQAATASTIDA